MTKNIFTYLKVLLRSVLFVAIPYSLLFLSVDYFMGNVTQVVFNLEQGLAFALVLSIIIYFNRNRHPAHGVLSKAKHAAEATLSIKTDFNRLYLALQASSFVKSSKLQAFDDVIVLKTDPSLLSWGERIKIYFKPDVENDSTFIHLSSQSLLRSTALDKRKNQSNIDEIQSIIQQL